MPSPQPPRLHPAPALSCLVCGADGTLSDELIARLRRSARVGSAEAVQDPVGLQHALTVRALDLLVYVLDAPDEPLPRCLAMHPDLRVLVVAPNGVVGTLSRWLQQGANDLVSPDDEDGLAHALSRLLDECALLAELRQQETVIATQRRRIDTLLRRRANDRDVAIPARSTATGQPSTRASRVIESTDGLPGRRQSLRRLLVLRERAAGTHGRQKVIALRIGVPYCDPHTSPGPLDQTLCDLAMFRAADIVRQTIPRRLLLGRSSRNVLTVLLPCQPGVTQRSVTRTLRAALGTLGHLLDRTEDLTLHCVAGTLADLADADLLERLDSAARPVLEEDESVVQILPVLSARMEPRLSAARS